MPVVSINGSLTINEEELSDFVRSEIDSSDFGELMGDAASEAMGEWDFDQMQYDINELDSTTDRHDDRLDDVERDIEQLKELATENKEDWKAVRGGEISPEVDAALKRQHQRITELEHAMLCIFEHLHSPRQRNLAQAVKIFSDNLTDPTGE
jgi:hypothetical protein